MTEIRKITLQFPSLRAFLAAYGERISAEGMLLHSETPPAAGSPVEIQVVVADGMRLVRARGETLWSGAVGDDNRKVAAVRFQELDDGSRKLIDKIVEQRERDGLEPFDLTQVHGPRPSRLRDLTVPAMASESGRRQAAAADPVFDLAEPPATGEADLFAPPPAPAAPPPPVPLLDDVEPVPLDLNPAPDASEDPAAERPDLSELFGDDEPEGAPARGHTEAFPPSFVDEVEAELEAAEPPPAPVPLLDSEAPPAALGGEIPVDLEAVPDLELAPELTEAELTPEPLPEAKPPPALIPELTADKESAAEPEPAPATGVESASSDAPSVDLPAKVAAAFDAARGPETVEVPLLPVGIETASGERLPPIDTPPEVAPPPPPPSPPPAEPVDDNLLSIPEFAPPSQPAAEVEMREEESLATSAESLRGTGSRSRRLGTWLLIALLAGALGVAGYFIYGLLRDGGETAVAEAETESPATAETVEPSPTESPLAEPAEATPPEEPAEGAGPAAEAAGDEAVAATSLATPEEPREPSPVAEPLAPLTGLDRVTWSETETETALSLVGDGEISRRSVELIPIGGEQPRLLIKLSGISRAFQPAVLEVGTAHVQRVRTGLHAGGELHVVVDLAAAGVAALDWETRGARLEVRLGGP